MKTPVKRKKKLSSFPSSPNIVGFFSKKAKPASTSAEPIVESLLTPEKTKKSDLMIIDLADEESTSTPIATHEHSNKTPVENQRKSSFGCTIKSPGLATPSDVGAVKIATLLEVPIKFFHPLEDITGCSHYSFLADMYDNLSRTSSRLAKRCILVNTYRMLMWNTPHLVEACIKLSSNQLMEKFEDLTTGIGGATVRNALQQAFSASAQKISALYREHGDLGDVASCLKSSQRLLVQPPRLRTKSIWDGLNKMAKIEGTGVDARRQALIVSWLRACTGSEAKWLVRTLISNIRTGATLDSHLGAVAVAACIHSVQRQARVVNQGAEDNDEWPCPDLTQISAAEAAIKQTFSLCPSIGRHVDALIGVAHGGESATFGDEEQPVDPIVNMQNKCSLSVGIPIVPQLAKPMSSVITAVTKVAGHDYSQPFTAEFKYDGQRAQIHMTTLQTEEAATATSSSSSSSSLQREVRIFSRDISNMTSKYPDVVATVLESCRDDAVKDFVLDCEIVPLEPQQKTDRVIKGDPGTDGSKLTLAPFQVLSKRRKTDVTVANVEIEVICFVFDILWLDGHSVMEQSLENRRALLNSLLNPLHRRLQMADQIVMIRKNAEQPHKTPSEDLEETNANDDEGLAKGVSEPDVDSWYEGEVEGRVSNFLTKSVQAGCEGLILKTLDHPYVPSRAKERSDSWIKLKKDYLDSLGDSFDVVPIGAWYGNGRKVNWFSPILLAVYDPSSGSFQSICRCMSGLTDDFYKELTSFYTPLAVSNRPHKAYPAVLPYRTNESPSVWFPACKVWEIRGADITVSPVHQAATGLGLAGSLKGLALRFPRFRREREDKQPEDATSSGQVAAAFHRQSQRAGPVDAADVAEDDDFLL
jgi:DNA ligase-1